ncbi:hypothetical protein HYX16_03990 [Candidatus Woesearchaeota archaeon]|nr:hypothetical protein [Candidatus Woesearchaeota archaeon]
MKEIHGNVTCPKCGHVQKMNIPADSCIPFYKCNGCKKTISAKEKCCVFCDYGDKTCQVNHK